MSELAQRLQTHGLYLRGSTALHQQEIEDYAFAGDEPVVTLVGNIGSSYWPHFSRSVEYRDGRENPLDRWSRRVADEICRDLPLRPLFPFAGPPYYPFLQWAERAEALSQSPLGLMIHADFGLWHSYRFALLGAQQVSPPVPAPSPCLTCAGQPCLHSCPVNAFDHSGYAVDACASFLKHSPQAECHSHGCMARYNCPVAREHRYEDEQSQFHLRAFLADR